MTSPATHLVWATDIHLDHAEPDRAMEFLEALRSSHGNGLLLGGDISTARSLASDLELIADTLERPVYFVLGNHEHSAVMLTDYFVINELAEAYDTDAKDMTLGSQPALKTKLGELGRESATTLKPHLSEAATRFDQVIVLTHVPPFPEAAWHEGAPSTDDWLPGFSCRAVGEELLRVAEKHPDTNFTVLCGHTHGDGVASLRPNLNVHTQGAEYGHPGYLEVTASRKQIEVGTNRFPSHPGRISGNYFQ